MGGACPLNFDLYTKDDLAGCEVSDRPLNVVTCNSHNSPAEDSNSKLSFLPINL